MKRGLVHGAVSARNVIVDAGGSAFLADLGLARAGSVAEDRRALGELRARVERVTRRRRARRASAAAVAAAAGSRVRGRRGRRGRPGHARVAGRGAPRSRRPRRRSAATSARGPPRVSAAPSIPGPTRPAARSLSRRSAAGP